MQPIWHRPQVSSETVLYPMDCYANIAKAAFWLTAACACIFTLLFIRHPVIYLLKYIADDGFYYLQTARHIARTGRSTFDGIHPANGYHPAWMAIMAISGRLFPGRIALIHVCLLIEIGFQIATGFLLAKIFRPFLGCFWGYVGGAFWLVNPLPLRLAFYGVEASLAAFSIALAVWAFVTILTPALEADAPFRPSNRQLALLGLSLSLVFLSRTDAIFLIFGLFGFLTFAVLGLPPTRPSVWALGRTLGIIGGVFLLGVLPWLAYSEFAFGTLQQSSGVMKMLWNADAMSGVTFVGRLHSLFDFITDSWLGIPLCLITGDSLAPSRGNSLGRIVLLTVLAVFALVRYRHPIRSLLCWLLAGSLLTGCASGLLLTDHQNWHYMQPAIVLYLLLFLSLGLLIARLQVPWAHWFSAVVILGLSFSWTLDRFMGRPVVMPWQQDVFRSQPEFEARVPASARIGCFNAGIPAYFSDRTIINLDGLVNTDVVPYWRDHRFDQYLKDDRIAYIMDEQDAVHRAERFSSVPLRLRPIASHPLKDWRHPVRWLWEVH